MASRAIRWAGLRDQPAFRERAGARTGFSAFFGASLTVSLTARLPLPEIGSSISRWPLAALRGFLPLALTVSLPFALPLSLAAAGAACFSLARLRLSAS